MKLYLQSISRRQCSIGVWIGRYFSRGCLNIPYLVDNFKISDNNAKYKMKMIKGSFSRKINKINDKEGKIWQKGFYDECITGSLHLIQKLEYLHNNPVKAGIASSPEEYLYSSYNHYIKTDYPANPIIKKITFGDDYLIFSG